MKYSFTGPGPLGVAAAVALGGFAVRPLWVTALEQSGRQQVSVPLPKSGNYEIVVRMSGFGGDYQVEYTVR